MAGLADFFTSIGEGIGGMFNLMSTLMTQASQDMADGEVHGAGSTTPNIPIELALLYNKLIYGSKGYWDNKDKTFHQKDIETEFGFDDTNSIIGLILGTSGLTDQSPFTQFNDSVKALREKYAKHITNDQLYDDTYKVSANGLKDLLKLNLGNLKTQVDKMLLADNDNTLSAELDEISGLATKAVVKPVNYGTEVGNIISPLKQLYESIYGKVKANINTSTDVFTGKVTSSTKGVGKFSASAIREINAFVTSNIIPDFISTLLGEGNVDLSGIKDTAATFTSTKLVEWFDSLPNKINSVANSIIENALTVVESSIVADIVSNYADQIEERYTNSKGKINAALVAQNAANSSAIMYGGRLVERDKQLAIEKFESDLKLKLLDIFANTSNNIMASFNSTFVPFYQSTMASEAQVTSLIGGFIDAYIRMTLMQLDQVKAMLSKESNDSNSLFAGYNGIYGNYFVNQKNYENQVLNAVVSYVMNNYSKHDDQLVDYYKNVMNTHYLDIYKLYSDFYGKAQQVEVLDKNWKLDTLGKGLNIVASNVNGAVHSVADPMPGWAMALQASSATLSAGATTLGSLIP